MRAAVQTLARGIERIVESICTAHRAGYQIDYPISHPAVVNDMKMAEIVKCEANKVVLDREEIVPHRTMIGEDFCEYARKIPSAFYFIGAGNKEKEAHFPHHHPSFDIDEDVLMIGAEMHVRTAMACLDHLQKS